MRRSVSIAVAPSVPLLLLCLSGGAASAGECSGILDRGTVVGCALAANLDVRQARLELSVIGARRIGAGLFLPSNPVVSGSVEGSIIRPTGATQSSPLIEWQITLAQEIEIAGQRGARLTTNDAQTAAQIRRVAVAEQETAAMALRAYFEVATAKANLKLAEELAQASDLLARFAEERAKESLLAPVDAHLVRAEAVRIGLLRADARRRVESARAALAALLGRMTPDVDAAIDQLPSPLASVPALSSLTDRALLLRGELAAAEMERTVVERQLSIFRRSRIPNLTVSAFTALNVIGEQVVGGTLSLPIPLPAPIGRTYRAEIAEATVRKQQAEVTIEQVRRRVRLEVAQALVTERARAAGLDLFPPTLVQQALSDVAALREGVATRQLSVREALVSERTLIELLLSDVEARLAYADAWVELKRAVGELSTEAPR